MSNQRSVNEVLEIIAEEAHIKLGFNKEVFLSRMHLMEDTSFAYILRDKITHATLVYNYFGKIILRSPKRYWTEELRKEFRGQS